MDFMLCKEREEPINRDGWIAEKKFDGSRVKIVIDGGIKSLTTRRGEEIVEKFPEFEDVEVEGKWVLDGEICYFEEGKSRFNKLLFRTNQENEFKIEILSEKYPCKLVVFDVLKEGGEDLRNEKLKDRVGELKKFMDKIKKGKEHFIRPKQHSNILELWQEVIDNNLEGIIMKNLNSKYVGERSSNWLKIKCWEEAVLEFNKYEEHNRGITIENDDEIRVSVLGKQSKEVANKINKNGSVEAEIQYLERTKNGKYRQPTFKRLK